MKNSDYTSDAFIARWIAGELTETEVHGLNDFIEREPGAIKFFEEIKEIWLGKNNKRLAHGLSGDERWEKLNKKLNLKNENQNGEY